jgi:hypothetical protein
MIPDFEEMEATMARQALCRCGSGEDSYWHYDARGIELGKWCDKCAGGHLKGYRQDVLDNANYEADEDIDGEGQ